MINLSAVTLLLTADQALSAIARLEPRARLTPRQLRDLVARGCVVPRAMPGGRCPRVFDLGDLLLLRLVARMQADEMLARWQAWAVVANLRGDLRAALLGTLSRVLVVQGARGLIVRPHEAEGVPGVPFDLGDVSRGVREAMRAEAGEVWTGFSWVSMREASALAR